MTKIAEPVAYCASCFQQDNTLRHVDFEAAYDGPVIPGTPEPVPVDDLVLCENCLEEAFVLLDPKGQFAEIARLKDYIAVLEDDNAAKDRAVHSAEETITELVDHPIKKHPGRRSFLIDDPETKHKLLSQRDNRAKKVKA